MCPHLIRQVRARYLFGSIVLVDGVGVYGRDNSAFRNMDGYLWIRIIPFGIILRAGFHFGKTGARVRCIFCRLEYPQRGTSVKCFFPGGFTLVVYMDFYVRCAAFGQVLLDSNLIAREAHD